MDLHDYLRAGWRLLFTCEDGKLVHAYLTNFKGSPVDAVGLDMLSAMDDLCRKLKGLEVEP